MWAFKITLQLSLIHKQQTNLQIKSPCAAIPPWVNRQFGCKKKLPARGANQFAGFGKFHLLANLEKIKYKILQNLDNKNELKMKPRHIWQNLQKFQSHLFGIGGIKISWKNDLKFFVFI